MSSRATSFSISVIRPFATFSRSAISTGLPVAFAHCHQADDRAEHRVGDVQRVGPAPRHRLPEAVADLELLPVVGHPDVCGQRRLLRILGHQGGDVLLSDPGQALPIAGATAALPLDGNRPGREHHQRLPREATVSACRFSFVNDPNVPEPRLYDTTRRRWHAYRAAGIALGSRPSMAPEPRRSLTPAGPRMNQTRRTRACGACNARRSPPFALSVHPSAVPRMQPLSAAEWTDVHRALVTSLLAPDIGSPSEQRRRRLPRLFRHPALVSGVMPFATYISEGSTLSPRHRQLLILRTAWLCRSQYEWATSRATCEGRRAHRTGDAAHRGRSG